MNFEAIKKAAQDYRPAMAKFLRDDSPVRPF